MPHRLSPILLARLRASTRLAALVLMIFVMKIGMVTACSMHDLGDLAGGGSKSAAVSATLVDKAPDNSDSVPGPFTHGAAGCVDCSCHHAAALLPEAPHFSFASTQIGPIDDLSPFHLLAPRRELRPPIA